MPYSSIRPGQPWLDTNGHRIQAHGGSLTYMDGTFYWYGENKEHTKPGSGIWHWGVRCYSSPDLYNWHDEGLIIPPVEDDENSPLHPTRLLDRPHIVRSPQSGSYLCWVKIMSPTTQEQTVTVLRADNFLGPYEIVRTGMRPFGMSAGDFDLVVAADGKGYYYFERVHSELICADLNDEYTSVTGHYSTHFPRDRPPRVREAPAYFTRNGLHYLLTSGTTAYFPNRSEIAVADTYHGPWRELGDPHCGDATSTSFRSQISSVFRHPAKRDLYIAIADRWLPGTSEWDSARAWELFRRMFGGEPFDHEDPLLTTEADTSVADYVWLPINFKGDRPVIEWHDEWRIEDYE